MTLRIKTLRKEKGLSQAELAEMAGLDRSQLSKIENEKEPANTRRLSAIAEALGCEIAELFEGGDPTARHKAALWAILPDLTDADREAVLAHARGLAAMRKSQG